VSVLSLPVTLPDHQFARISIRPQNATARTNSPFTFAAQTQIWTGQRWRADVSLPIKSRADAEAWLAALTEIAGGVGELHIGDPAGASPEGSWGGSPTVQGGSQTGQTLDIDGLSSSVTGIAKAGDYFQVGSGTSRRLYKLVEDADSNGSGEATLKFWPYLRESPSDNAAVVVNDTRGTFEIPGNVSWTWQPPDLTVIEFTAVEAI
jgi:hypothetical protein